MNDDSRIWVELILQGQRDLEEMAKQEKEEKQEKPSQAMIEANKREMELAATNIGITLKQFASVWKPDMTAQQLEEAIKNLKTKRGSKQAAS